MVGAKGSSKDLTVLATPLYIVALFIEHAVLRRRRVSRGPTPGDYERRDTLASLLMGQLSLLIPLATARLARKLAPPGGRYAKWLVAVATSLLGVSVAADALARRRARTVARAVDPQLGPQAADVARTVAGASAVGALATGGVAVASWWSTALTPTNFQRWSPLPDRGDGALAFAVAMVGWDFIYYWNHRFMHTSRYMWAMHVVHHSSEHYNLSTALRQPVAEALTTPVPYGLICLLGVRPETVARARGLNLLYQFWIHTETLNRLGPAEGVLNSPSAHRVHHGSNSPYLDRNHGGILILWDRLFGTYEEEKVPVIYGLTKNINTFNPFVIVGHEYAAIARDVARASSWRDRLSHVVRGPGWRPTAPLSSGRNRLALVGGEVATTAP